MSGLTIDNPIKFADLLTSQNVRSGDVLLLLPGTYTGDWVIPSWFAGTTIKPYTPGTVTIDGSMKVLAQDFKIYDLNFTDSRADRHLQTPGVDVSVKGAGVHGCLISDMHMNGVTWFSSGAGEVSENVIMNNGFLDALGDGKAHGIYTHNNTGGARTIARNVIGDQMGRYSLQIYSSGDNFLRDYTVEDNIFCGDAVTTGGGSGLLDFVYRRNIQYIDHAQLGRYSDEWQNKNAIIEENVFIDLVDYTVNADCQFEWLNLVERGNTVYGGHPIGRAGYENLPQPATWTRIIPFSKSQRWVASVFIFNRDSAETVSVDFSSIPAGTYKLRNGQNPAETWQFDNTGIVNVPTNWTAAQKIGEDRPATTWLRAGGLVVERA